EEPRAGRSPHHAVPRPCAAGYRFLHTGTRAAAGQTDRADGWEHPHLSPLLRKWGRRRRFDRHELSVLPQAWARRIRPVVLHQLHRSGRGDHLLERARRSAWRRTQWRAGTVWHEVPPHPPSGRTALRNDRGERRRPESLDDDADLARRGG